MIQKLTFLIQTCLNISAVNNIRVDAFSFFMKEGRCAGYTKWPSWDRAHIILSWVLIHWFFLIISIHLSRSSNGLIYFPHFLPLDISYYPHAMWQRPSCWCWWLRQTVAHKTCFFYCWIQNLPDHAFKVRTKITAWALFVPIKIPRSNKNGLA